MSTDFPLFTKTFHTSIYPAIDPNSEALSAKGKVVVVAGGSKGIGKAVAVAFASAGARAVIIIGRTTAALEVAVADIAIAVKASAHETTTLSFAVNICDAAAISHTFEEIRRDIGAVDVFIHSAAADIYLSTIEDCSVDVYWSSFETNAKGLLNCMKAFLASGVNKDAAQVPTFINVSTIGIAMTPAWSMSSYSASKLAAWNMVESLSVEMGDRLRVFSIHPGRVATDMAKKAGIPTFDDKELPGAFCVWLAATPGADFLRGRLVACNWDVDELLERRNEIVDRDMLRMTLAGWSP